ncbi:Ras-related protein Ral-a [Sarcoptes scabiei]|uniref:RAS-like protein 4 n=1 Tax=Sarcoptes scabiei TaxID=52283 RepID=A0A131ZXU1_SARSC|nr:Ras-related protein Ral-a [Sarcoptes scabiei]KPM03319.1 RAS-like protein 4 [Sarcoptes scabiei]UXI20531.1 sorbitol dehydrogenase-like [Sarcoptes scabiei]
MSVHKILILGDKNVGKRSFKQKLQKDESDNEDITAMTMNRFLSWNIDDKALRIEFKIVEPDEYAAIRDSFYRTASGFICMFSVDSPESLQTIEKMYEQILAVRSQTRLILCGNKCDLPKKSRKISKRDAKKLAKKWKAEYFETSVVNNENLEDCLDLLLRAIVEKKHTRKVRERSSWKATLDRFKYYNCLQ